MDRFVKRFIITSIIYLGIASIIGVLMLSNTAFLSLRFIHSHLMLLGWVSMMIFGVGYHILPRFSGKPLKSVRIGEIQYWLANIGLIGMVILYTLDLYTEIYKSLLVLSGLIEVLAIFLFLYNMLATLLEKVEQEE